MVYDTYCTTIVNGVYKPTYSWGVQPWKMATVIGTSPVNGVFFLAMLNYLMVNYNWQSKSTGESNEDNKPWISNLFWGLWV